MFLSVNWPMLFKKFREPSKHSLNLIDSKMVNSDSHKAPAKCIGF